VCNGSDVYGKQAALQRPTDQGRYQTSRIGKSEKYNSMMDASRARAHIQKRAKVQGWEQLRADLQRFRRRVFSPPAEVLLRPLPEVENALEVIKAHEAGGTRAARGAFEQCRGVRLDPLAMESLRPDLEHTEDLVVPHLARRLEEHCERLRRKQEAADVPDETERIRRGIKRYPSLDVSLNALRVAGQSHEEALRERIPGVAYVAKADSSPNSNIAGRAADAIRREGLERPDEPDLLVPLSRDLKDDVPELVAFVQREDLWRDVSRAGLSPQEWETFLLVLDGLSNAEIAAELGRTNVHVRQNKHGAVTKIRKYCQASGL
jgi:hypothetical protein